MPLVLSGSIFISGSMMVSGSLGYTGSFTQPSGSIIYLPTLSGSYSTSSFCTSSYYSGSELITGSCPSASLYPTPGLPFLYVINGVLLYYNGSSWNQLFP